MVAPRRDALFAEGGNNAVLGGVRFYFGQRDKTLIDRNRQDDPVDETIELMGFNGGASGGISTRTANGD
jgi:hypothetical protein